ncbi:MAG: hypothetical protein LBG72_01365 [Spirochaetaceae bacterium]|jgi:hypothetical protein|nr:hypothetical protein [Spirochaetaceae bacterium]
MSKYSGIQKEETLKAQIFADLFDSGKHAYAPNIDNIDFVVTAPEAPAGALFPLHLLWAEAKKGAADVMNMLTQLILTCRKTVDRGLHLPPPYLGCFDSQKIAFIPFYDILPLFVESDVNWNAVPHDHSAADFQKLREKVTKLSLAHLEVFQFETDADDVKAFIKNNLHSGARSAKIKINKNNFIHIFYRWVKDVKPFINLSEKHWAEYKKQGIFDCDFFRADMMSAEALTLENSGEPRRQKFSSITDKLEIVLREDTYDIPKLINDLPYHTAIDWTDGGEAYRKFWAKYERPPAEEYREYIVRRRDLLVDQNIREIRGEFFTPPEWVELSQEYLARAFGDDWQKEYYIWDCCAGNGNLLVGLQEPDRIWASDISNANVKNMIQLAADRHTLRESHIFQFDFLNDYFEVPGKDTKETIEKAKADVQKLKDCGLYEIINDKEKRKKLIIYINPPYAESGAGIGSGINKPEVVIAHQSHDWFLPDLGKASHELYSQFFARIMFKLPDARLATFSTLKYLNSYNFTAFRKFFRAEFKCGFMCKANTFENVTGEFPIGFIIWNLNGIQFPSKIKLDIMNNECLTQGVKTFYSNNNYINTWMRKADKSGEEIAVLHSKGIDFQNNQGVWLCINQTHGGGSHFKVTNNNIYETAIYFSVRNIIKHTWINHNNQFLYPNEEIIKDEEFKNNCLVFMLLADKNRISSAHGINHWIPFTEEEVGAAGEFKSRFMSRFLEQLPTTESTAVLAAGRALFRYYHETIRGSRKAPVDASFYDIREYFQMRNEKGKMNPKSADETYNTLLAELRAAQKALAQQIAPKIYEYGFLKG